MGFFVGAVLKVDKQLAENRADAFCLSAMFWYIEHDPDLDFVNIHSLYLRVKQM